MKEQLQQRLEALNGGVNQVLEKADDGNPKDAELMAGIDTVLLSAIKGIGDLLIKDVSETLEQRMKKASQA